MEEKRRLLEKLSFWKVLNFETPSGDNTESCDGPGQGPRQINMIKKISKDTYTRILSRMQKKMEMTTYKTTQGVKQPHS